MLIWVITDQEKGRRYFWSWVHVMIGGLQIMTRSFIDTSNNKTGIFTNILGLFYVLQYCLPFKLPFKLRLQKKLLARGSWVLFYMFIFHHWLWLKWRLFFRENVFCRQILTDSLYFVGFIIFLYAQPSNYVLSLRARCIDNKRKFSQQ